MLWVSEWWASDVVLDDYDNHFHPHHYFQHQSLIETFGFVSQALSVLFLFQFLITSYLAVAYHDFRSLTLSPTKNLLIFSF